MPGLVSLLDSDIVRRDDGSWLIDGTVPLMDGRRVDRVLMHPVAEAAEGLSEPPEP